MYALLSGLVIAVQAVCAEDALAGHLLVGLSPNSNFSPRTYKPVEPYQDLARRHSAISGLLQRRQSACLSGYGLCPNNRCCPVGGDCCLSTGSCCAAGKVCYGNGCCNRGQTGCGGRNCCQVGGDCCSDGGCCDSGHYCVSLNGQAGCCVKGQACGSGGNVCSDRGNIKCPNENFCCPPGQSCYRDSSNQVRCGTPQKPPVITDPTPISTPKSPVITTPDTTRSSRAPDTPRPITTPSTTITTTRTTTPGPQTTTIPPTTTRTPSTTSTLSVPTATPPPTIGFVNQIVGASDPRITYFGDGWTQGTSSCFDNIRSAQVSGLSHSLQFVFQGTGIYMNVAKSPNAGIFGVTLLNDQNQAVDATIEVDAFAASGQSTCGIGWQRLGLQLAQYTLVVDVLGASQQASQLNLGMFELLNFLTVVPESQAGNSNASNSGSTSTKDLSRSYLIWVSLFAFFLLFC